MTTITISIENAMRTIKLIDLLHKGKPRKHPWITFKDTVTWDSPNYVHKFLKGVKKDKRKQVLEFRKLCKDLDFNYDETRVQLLKIFKQSKKLKLWDLNNF